MEIDSQLFEGLFKTAYPAIIVINDKGIVEQFNPSAERLFLYSKEEILGKNISLLMDSPHKEKHDQYIRDYLKTHVTHNVIGKGREVVARQKDGAQINIFISVSEAKVNGSSHFIAIITNIDEVFGMRKALKKLATYDQLTQAYSRGYFESHIQNWLMEFKHNKQSVSFLMLDLDSFKRVNDDLGHHIGDLVLIEFSNRVKSCLKENDYLVRLGGDEFLIISAKNQEQALELANKVLSASEGPYSCCGSLVLITPSIGVYANAKVNDLSRLLQRVDFALYEAKKHPSSICLFTEGLEDKFRAQNKLEQIVRDSFEKAENFYLVFQPIVNIQNNEVVALEALLRLKHGNEDISIEDFIHAIETLRLSEKLNEMIADKLLSALQKYTWPQDKLIKFSFNLSPHIYHLQSHLEKITSILSHFIKDHLNFRFEIEMTESKIMEIDAKYPGQWPIITDLLKIPHVSLAIDDFGKEYSSINRLLEYKVSTIKIDKFFISQLVDNNHFAAKSILRSLFSLGKELDVNIIAEGVENQIQLSLLKTMDCQLAQGYLFFTPLPEGEAFSLLGAEVKPED